MPPDYQVQLGDLRLCQECWVLRLLQNDSTRLRTQKALYISLYDIHESQQPIVSTSFRAKFSCRLLHTMPSQLVIVAVFDCRCHALKACQSVARWVTSMRLYLGMLAWTWARQKTPMVQADIYLILMPSEFASPFSEMWICSFQLFGPFIRIYSFNLLGSKSLKMSGCFMLLNTGFDPVPSKHGLLTTIGYKLSPEATFSASVLFVTMET